MLKGSSSNRRYATPPTPPPPVLTGFAWGFNVSNPSQLVTPTGSGLTLAQRRLNELQAGWDVGARFPRIDAETAEADRCRQIGFPKWIVILGAGKNFCTDAAAITYLNSYPEAWIEAGNELNLGSTWTYQQLAARHIQFYQNVKAVHPNCTILLASIGNSESTQGNLTPLQWAQGLAVSGCLPGTAFDVANYHEYELEFYHWKTLDGAGNSVQKTFGFPQYVFSEWGKRSDGSAGGDATQATTIAQHMDYIRDDPKCVGGHIYAMNDDAEGVGASSAPYGYGLRYLDGTHKPSWNTFSSKAITGTPWVSVINTDFAVDGVLPAPWVAYGPFANGYYLNGQPDMRAGYYLPSHVSVSGGICTLLQGYETSGPARVAPYNTSTGAGWYQGTMYAQGIAVNDFRLTTRMRVVSTNNVKSHRNLPLMWDNTGNWPYNGEEDVFESDPVWNPPDAQGKELPIGYFHFYNTTTTPVNDFSHPGAPGPDFVFNYWPRVDLSQWHVYRMQKLNHKISVWIDDMVTPVWEHQWTETELPSGVKHPVFQQENPSNSIPPSGTTGSEQIQIDYVQLEVPGDLARQRPASASSEESALYSADKANDGDSATRWSSSYADNQWWQVDLGTAQQIDTVSLNWEAAYASSYKIQVSSDGSTFTDVASVSNTQAGWKTTTFTAVAARFVRVLGLTRATVYGFSFWDAQVFGP